jgi:hypothetical protein
VLFTPTRAGLARGQLTVRGAGMPLTVALRPRAFPLPAITRLVPAGSTGCTIPAGDPIAAATSQRATVHWTLTRAPANERRGCGRTTAPGGAPVAAGRVVTSRRRGLVAGTPGYRAQWRLGGPAASRPGRYVLTASATDEHGAGPSRSMTVTIRS